MSLLPNEDDIFLILRCKVLIAICKMGSDGLISSQYLPDSTLQYSIFDPLPCSGPIRSRIGLISRSKMEERCTDTNLLEKQGKFFDLQLQFCIACLIHFLDENQKTTTTHVKYLMLKNYKVLICLIIVWVWQSSLQKKHVSFSSHLQTLFDHNTTLPVFVKWGICCDLFW